MTTVNSQDAIDKYKILKVSRKKFKSHIFFQLLTSCNKYPKTYWLKRTILLCSQILWVRKLDKDSRNGFFLHHDICDFSWEDSRARDNPKDGWNHLKSRSLPHTAFGAVSWNVSWAVGRSTPCNFSICPVFPQRMVARVIRLLHCSSGSNKEVSPQMRWKLHCFS